MIRPVVSAVPSPQSIVAVKFLIVELVWASAKRATGTLAKRSSGALLRGKPAAPIGRTPVGSETRSPARRRRGSMGSISDGAVGVGRWRLGERRRALSQDEIDGMWFLRLR